MSPEDHWPEVNIGVDVSPFDCRTVTCRVGVGGITKGYWVKLSNGVINEVVAAGASKPYGVALSTVAAGGECPILVYGVVVVRADG